MLNIGILTFLLSARCWVCIIPAIIQVQLVPLWIFNRREWPCSQLPHYLTLHTKPSANPIRYIHPGISQSTLLSRSVRHLSAPVGNPQLDRLCDCVLGFNGLPDRVWSRIRWTQWDWIPVARDPIHGILWCHAWAAHWCYFSVDSGMLSLSCPPGSGFADKKNRLDVVLFTGWDVVQFRDCNSAIRFLRCHHSVPRHSGLATSVVVRAEPLDQDHLLDAHHRTTVRPFLPFFSSLKGKPNHLVFSSGLKITCNPEEFTVFNPPLGETCVNWANDFVQHFGGYLDNPTETALCRYCPVAVGDEYYTPLNMSFGNRWRDVWLIFAFFGMSSSGSPSISVVLMAFLVVFNGVLVVLASRFLRYAKR